MYVITKVLSGTDRADWDAAAPAGAPITAAHAEVLRFLLDFYDARKLWPSITEMCAALGLARGTVHHRLEQLQKRGHLIRHGHCAYQILRLPKDRQKN